MSPPNPGPIALRAAAEAEENVGVTETGGENRGKYVEIYQASCVPPIPPGSPWCAAMVVYREKNAAHDLGLTIPNDWPRSGWVPDHVRWAKAKDLWVPAARALKDGTRGDLVCFYFAAKGRCAHIGIVVGKHATGKLLTVEGNTSDDTPGVDRDGDGVFYKVRSVGSLGQFGGLVRLPF